MTVQDMEKILSECPDKDKEILIDTEDVVLYRIAGVYVDGEYYIIKTC